jgi:hypothetical protein
MPDHGDEEAEALFQKAVEIARRQEAKSLEVRAATSVQYHRHSLGSVRQADGARSLSHRLRSTPAPGSRKGGTCPGLARIIHEAAGIGALRLSWGTADVVAHGVAAAGEPLDLRPGEAPADLLARLEVETAAKPDGVITNA